MFNVIKTRAAVSILEWVTSFFFAHSSGGLLGGRPAPGIDFAYFFFFFSQMEISPVLSGVSLVRNWKISVPIEHCRYAFLLTIE